MPSSARAPKAKARAKTGAILFMLFPRLRKGAPFCSTARPSSSSADDATGSVTVVTLSAAPAPISAQSQAPSSFPRGPKKNNYFFCGRLRGGDAGEEGAEALDFERDLRVVQPVRRKVALGAEIRIELDVASIEGRGGADGAGQLLPGHLGGPHVELGRLEVAACLGELGAVMQAQVLAARHDRHRVEEARQVLDGVLDVPPARRGGFHQLVQLRARLEKDALVARAQSREHPRARESVQVLETVLKRREDALVGGSADALGVPAKEKSQVGSGLPYHDPRIQLGHIPRHHVLPIDFRNEAAHLVDHLAKAGAHAPA